MIKQLLYRFIFVVLVLSTTRTSAQLAFNFSTSIYGQSLEGLSFVQLINTSGNDLKGFVTIKVREASGQDVVSITTKLFAIKQGANIIPRDAFSTARYSFSNNYPGNILSQTGRFAEGEYEYCFEVDISESKQTQLAPVFENCFIEKIQPLTPLLLIDPVDGDENCNKRPNFLWQPPLPLSINSRFRVIVTEVKEKQDIAEAIAFNIPVINQWNLSGNLLNYPPSAPDLKEGVTYAWQVIVYSGKLLHARSEIWTFKIKCKEKTADINTDSYRELKETDEGDFYIADHILRFSFNNPYSSGTLSYSIENLSEKGKTINDLPVLLLSPGLNKYDLDLSENKNFKNNNEYLLKVKLADNRELRVRFILRTSEIIN